MDTAIFATTRAASTPQTGASTGVMAQGNALGGGNGVFSALTGMSFIDLIFARITEGQDLKNDAAGVATTILTPQTEISADDVLTQFLDIGAEPVLSTDLGAEGDLSTAADPALPTPLSNSMQQLRSYLDTLLNGLPAEQRPQIVEVKPAEFKQMLANLQADLNAGDPALIATGLTPEKLSALMTKFETAEQNGTLNSLIMVKIVPPATAAPEKAIPLLLPRALVAIQEQAQTGEDAAAIVNPDTDDIVDADGITSVLNKLVTHKALPEQAAVAAADATATATTTAAAATKPVIDTLSSTPGGVSGEEAEGKLTGLDRALNNIEENIGKHTDAGKKIPSGLENAAEKIQSKIGAGASTVPGNTPGSVEASNNWQEVFPEGVDSLNIGINGKPVPMTSTATVTSLVTSAPQATYPHPATQAVAATISKAAAAGEDKAFNIKLDPPELGRVEVRMSIDKHNAVKAHLIIEKPETFMMLQRDAQILERSLQGIGLDTGDGGLSFELAQDNMFQNEGDRGGERYQSGSNAAGDIDSAETVMEATMSWHVDPETGMQHYNVLA